MPQILEIRDLSKVDADNNAADLRAFDGVPVEVVPQDDGLFTVRATYPDGAVLPTPATDAKPSQGHAPPRRSPTGGPMKISTNGIALIHEFESCKEPVPGGFKAYLDPVGVLTIGWGHTNHRGRQFDADTVWTQAECDAVFLDDMAYFESVVTRLVKVPLNQTEFDALVSFSYNVGDGNFETSTLLRKLNAGDLVGAASEFPRWNKADGQVLPGLVRRRACEALMFQGIPDSDYDGKPD